MRALAPDGAEAQPQPPKAWPAVFGRFEPQPPTAEEAEPPAATFVHSFVLKGLFASSTNAWAIVSDPGGEYLLRVGDELPGGVSVAEITEAGVRIITPDGEELIGFEE